MQKIWAPWRKKYIFHAKVRGCIFCQKPKLKKDAETLILERGKWVYSMLNLYPYNNGHVMIIPYRHISDLTELTPSESAEMMRLTQKSIKRLRKLLKPHGFNIGFNIGRPGGAGFDQHIHQHIVPRWIGDSNFMPVIGNTKVISQSLQEMRKLFLS